MNDITVIRSVIRYLGWLGLILVGISGSLAWRIIHMSKVTPEAVTVLGSFTSLAGVVVGAIGAMLVSTHTTPTADVVVPSNVTNVTNTPDGTATTEKEGT